jgi:hypothetical protein
MSSLIRAVKAKSNKKTYINQYQVRYVQSGNLPLLRDLWSSLVTNQYNPLVT